MNGTAQIVIAALTLASEFAPYAIAGVKELLSAIKAREEAGKPVTHANVVQLADEHGVDLGKVAGFISELTPKGQ